MHELDASHVTPAVRDALDIVTRRVGEYRVEVGSGWAPFVAACNFDSNAAATVPFAIGSIDEVRAVFASAQDLEGRAGFITPASVRPSSWWGRRAPKYRLTIDPTGELWRAGWSPLSVHRVEVVADSRIIELAIGDARVRPAPLLGRSAFENPN